MDLNSTVVTTLMALMCANQLRGVSRDEVKNTADALEDNYIMKGGSITSHVLNWKLWWHFALPTTPCQLCAKEINNNKSKN